MKRIAALLAIICVLGVARYAHAQTSQLLPNNDPCAKYQYSTASINVSSATDTQLVAAVTGYSIYVCDYYLNQVNGTGTLGFEYGTGTNCGTGKTSLQGPIIASTVASGVTNTNAASSGPDGSQFVVPPSNALCVISTGTIQQSGWVDYVQLPNINSGSALDQCATLPKKSAAINFASATTTQLVGLVANTPINVCGFILNQPAGTETFQFEYGTGSNCATGATALDGALTPSAISTTVTNTDVEVLAGSGTQLQVPAGKELCGVTTGSGQQSGVVTYVQSNVNNVASIADPCNVLPKQSATINFSSATTTQIIPATSSGQQAYVCNIYLEDAGRASTANTFKLEYGTKASTDCDTGATALTGPLTGPLTAGAAQSLGPGPATGTEIVVPTGTQLCGVTTQSSKIAGYVDYVIQ